MRTLSLHSKDPLTMPLTKSQKVELKKIDSVYRRIEEASENGRIKFEDYQRLNEFPFADFSEEKRSEAFERSRTRQEVFERSKQNSKTR